MKFYAFGWCIGICLSGLFNDGHISTPGLVIALILSTIAAIHSLFKE